MKICRLQAVLIVCAAVAAPALAQDRFGQPPQQQPQDFPQQQPSPQGFPQQGFPQPGFPPQGVPQQGLPGGGVNLDQLAQLERQDFGVQPTNQLHAGAMHAPTPASLPGGQVITTMGLVELMRSGHAPYLLLDVLGGPQAIPGAVSAVPASQPGHFNDQTQQQFAGFLQQMTGGNRQHPLVLYCQSSYCWMSYNAALRAINLGYTNVLWYRGGIEAWQAAGQPTQPARY